MSRLALIAHYAGFLILLANRGSFAADSKPVALKGFDPILLAQGKEVPGKPGLTTRYGKFSYLFTSKANQKLFDSAPAKHAVQLDGACIHMPTMKGDPNVFLVHGGKIYLAGSRACIDSVSGNPAAFIKVSEDVLRKLKVVAVMLFTGVEDIDYAGPVEVLSGAGYKIITVAASPDRIRTVAGIDILPDYTFADCPRVDLILLPGGAVPPMLDHTDPRIRWVGKAAKETPHILSVCNGAFWLANAGLLDGKEATTTFGNIPVLKRFEKIRVAGDKRFTDNGQIVTSAGLSAGIDGALHMVEKMQGAEAARQVALNIEYNWQPDSGFSRGALADRNLLWLRHSGLRGVTRGSIVKQSGDKDSWAVSWEVATQGISVTDFRKAFEKAAKGQNWALMTAAGDVATFAFMDPDGVGWEAQVTGTVTDSSTIQLTIKIRKSVAKSS